ncbi:MAG: hypothetical protein LAT68_12870 [Cyclobacteriaceae bacterium]|nr:hypothetical protein [Cyclobacteriaceae bacterium]MCH8517212.1 hypothetical protein [Cyclobacteriaceae bacterium]
MKTQAFHSFLFILTLIVVFLSSCEEIDEFDVLEGEWNLVKVELNQEPDNALLKLLPQYQENSDKEYKLYFDPNEELKVYYFSGDSLIYKKVGIWYIQDNRDIFLQFDDFIEGNFQMERTSPRLHQLYCRENTLRFGENVDYSCAKIILEKK